MAKVLKCGDLMPGCDTVIVGKDADEVFAKAEAHARKEHNMTIIPPNVVVADRGGDQGPAPERRRRRRPAAVAGAAPHALDDRRRRMPLLDRDAHDAAAARFDGVAADDLIGGPVGALDEDVRLEGRDDLRRRVLVEDDDRVDRRQRGEDFGALRLRRDRPRRALVPAHRRVGVEADESARRRATRATSR